MIHVDEKSIPPTAPRARERIVFRRDFMFRFKSSRLILRIRIRDLM